MIQIGWMSQFSNAVNGIERRDYAWFTFVFFDYAVGIFLSGLLV